MNLQGREADRWLLGAAIGGSLTAKRHKPTSLIAILGCDGGYMGGIFVKAHQAVNIKWVHFHVCR